jgi:predicted RND superfamily exporter protein
LCRKIIAARFWLLAALVLFTGIFGWQATRALPPDNALRVWFVEDDPRFKAYDAYQSDFGNDELILVNISPDGGEVFDVAFLKELAAFNQEVAELEHAAHVYSIIDSLHLTAAPGLPASPEQIELSSQELARAKQIAMADPLVRGQVVSEDADAVMIVVEPIVSSDFDLYRDKLVLDVRAIADRRFGDAARKPALAGNGVIYQGLNEVTARDFGVFLTVGLLVLFILLARVSRSWSIMFASIGVITIGTIASIGALGMTGHKLNLVTSLIPTLVMVLGLADAIHFPVALQRARARFPEADPKELAARAIAAVMIPCAMTTLTTMAGFLALSGAPIPAIRHMGVFSAVGAGACFVASVVLMSVLFVRHARQEGRDTPELRRLDAILAATRRALDARRGVLWAMLVAIIVWLGVGAAKHLEVDTFTLENLPENHRVVTDHHRIESSWGPYLRLEFLATDSNGARITEDIPLEQLDAFARHVEELPEISSAVYVGTVYRHSLINGLGPEVAAQKIAAANASGDAEVRMLRDEANQMNHGGALEQALAPVLSKDQKRARLMLTTHMVSASELSKTLDAIDAIARQHAPGLRVEAVGYPPLYVGIIDQVMRTLGEGFGWALLLVFGLIVFWLRSWRLAIASFIANLFPLLAMFGVMGWFGIQLDIATAAVAAIVLGVAVDDTIHFLHAWCHAEAEGLSWEDALDHTFAGAGRAAMVTSLLLVTGFPVLMLSKVTTVFAFGCLTTIAAIAALVGDIILLPLLLRVLRPKTDKTNLSEVSHEK